MFTGPILCFLRLPSAPLDNVKYFVSPFSSPQDTLCSFSIFFSLFCNGQSQLSVPFTLDVGVFLPYSSLVVWASPLFLPGFPLTPVTDLNTLVSVGSDSKYIS